jgi:hypothetical protein
MLSVVPAEPRPNPLRSGAGTAPLRHAEDTPRPPLERRATDHPVDPDANLQGGPSRPNVLIAAREERSEGWPTRPSLNVGCTNLTLCKNLGSERSLNLRNSQEVRPFALL